MRFLSLPGAAILLCLSFTSCSTPLGPASVKQVHRPYNDSVVQTLNEQFLLNLVRLKYRDNPYFIEIASITSSQSVGASVGSGSELNILNSAARLISPNVGVAYSDTPTISYSPLQGEEFSTKIMAPIPQEALLTLSQSGWSISRLFRIAVEQANHLHNAPTASGPTPTRPPEFEKFHKISEALRRMQQDNGIDMVVANDRLALEFVSERIPEDQRRGIRQAFGLSSHGSVAVLTTNPGSLRDQNTIYLQTRSIMGILFFLSHNVEVPEADIRKGLVTVTKYPDGTLFDWDRVSGDLLKVKSSASPPAGDFVKIKYRGSWFYIQDNDLESKSTFMLLNQLFSLQAGDIKKATPFLTIPVGR